MFRIYLLSLSTTEVLRVGARASHTHVHTCILHTSHLTPSHTNFSIFYSKGRNGAFSEEVGFGDFSHREGGLLFVGGVVSSFTGMIFKPYFLAFLGYILNF